MKPKCLNCLNFTRWEQPTGGTIPRCSHHLEVEEMIRSELRLWIVSGKWASTCEPDECMSLPKEVEPMCVCEEPGEDFAAAVQDYLDSRLVRIDEARRPVFRSVAAIEEDILWKFQGCRDFAGISEEESQDDPVLLVHFSDCREVPAETAPDDGYLLLEALITDINSLPISSEECSNIPCGHP